MRQPQTGRANPLKKSSLWSRVTFGFAEPLLRKGYLGAHIEADDVFQITTEERSDILAGRLQSTWSEEWMKHQRGQKASFSWALCRAMWKYYVFSGILCFLEESGRFFQPVLLTWILDYIEGSSNISDQRAWMYALGIGALAIVQALSVPQIAMRFLVSANRWKTATSAVIYRKMLRLSRGKLNELTTGHIIDLLNNDATRFHELVWNLHAVWLGPLKAIFGFCFMYRRLGASVIVGYIAIFILGPLQGLLAKTAAKFMSKMQRATDARVQLMTEIISGIRLIKMYCWEKPFGNLLSSLRQTELDHLWTIRCICSFLAELYTFNFRLISTSVIVAAVILGYDIKAATVFPMFAMFNVINATLMIFTSFGLLSVFDYIVSAKRIEAFLLLEEKTSTEKEKISPGDDGSALYIDHVTAKWDKNQDLYALYDISMKIPAGRLIAVVGQVGSGKSSLLTLIADEMFVSSGRINTSGDLAYATQQPWIFSNTIRENVLFGKDYNPLVFREVMDVTAMSSDLEALQYGDLTRVGDRGVMLSGGQKARLGLARAVYQQADIYLLDDPLSAVDTVVGRHIFDRCIKGYLKSKTRVLVTHQLQYLKEVDLVIAMDQGRIVQTGTYESLSSSGLDLSRFLSIHKEEDQKNEPIMSDDSVHRRKSYQQEEEVEEEEDKSRARLGWGVYLEYFTSRLKGGYLLLLLLINILCQVSFNGTDWWLTVWIKSNSAVRGSGDKGSHSTTFYVAVFIALTAVVYLFGLVRSFVFFKCIVKLCKHHHDKMYTSVIRSPTRFFDTNPPGRILNRFSADLNHLDTYVPIIVYDFMQQLIILLGSIALSVYLCPMLVVPTLLLSVYLYRMRTIYVNGQKGFNLLESVARSPIITHLKSTIDGIDTIRAHQKQKWCIDVYDDMSDALQSRAWTCFTLNSWFYFKMKITVAVFTCCSVVAYMMAKDYLDTSLLAMSLSYLVPIMWYLGTIGRLSAEIGSAMAQVERVLTYGQLPPEAPLDSINAPLKWPSLGRIDFEHVTFRYHDGGPEILKDVSLHIQPGEKIGIVGRTGAGKSSLIQALFRMSESSGNIYIDGIRTNTLGLHDVRGAISIIPQDPVLFSGPIRRNLDPFQQQTDHTIWQALKQVQMADVVRDLAGNLDSTVSEGGANFSVGQRQLLCLARAMLKHNKILVIDEATANVDRKTDELIQQAIRRVFHNCTVLTVAHRLNTIMDSDRIMVIANGRVVEFDAPHTLLQKGGAFSQLVAEAGQTEKAESEQVVEEMSTLKSASN